MYLVSHQIQHTRVLLIIPARFGAGEEITMDNKGMGVQEIIMFQ